MSRLKISLVLASIVALSACSSTQVYPVNSAESRIGFNPAFEAGYRFQNGIGIPKNYQLAVESYKKAEKSGDVRAMNNLGVMALRGQLGGFSSSPVSYFTKAASKGSSTGYYNLGLLAEVGQKKPNYGAAFNNYNISAQMGNAAAQYRLGQMYSAGIGTAPNPVESKRYFELAALGNNSQAIESLKSVHGKNLTLDDVRRIVGVENCNCDGPYEKAMSGRELEGLTQLAKQGDVTAQYNLGVKYLNGIGAPKNSSEAARYFETAARRGYGPAQRQMAQMYLRGDSVAPSKILGYAWLNLAARTNDTDGKAAKLEMQKLELSMTPAEVKQAQNIATSGALRGR